LFESAGSRLEVITTFLAVLELAKLRQLIAVQGERFGEIELAKRPPEEESESGETAEPESVGFTAGHSDVEVTGEGKPIAARRASLEVAAEPSEVLTMEVGELAHKTDEPLTFTAPNEAEEEPYDDPNLRELPLATDTGVGRTNRLAKRNRPKPWTAELNLDYPTKDHLIASAVLLVVTTLLCWVVF